MIYCFDLDNTLCNTEGSDYDNATPILDRIDKVNSLFDDGHTIIIDTARGNLSGRNHLYYTIEQLKSWGLKFHTVRTGKKFNADIFVDDRAIKDTDFFNETSFSESGSGNLTKLLLVERVRKEATRERMTKLIDEYEFLKSIPKQFKRHFPEIIHFGKNENTSFYEMQHYQLPSMRRLIFTDQLSHHDVIYWTKEILKFNKNLLNYQLVECDDNYMFEMHWNRFEKRNDELQQASSIFRELFASKTHLINGKQYVNPAIIVEKLRQKENEFRPLRLGRFSHADLHFSNILLDQKNENFIFVDPRGYDRCDLNYDLGKIWHSVNGKYEMVANNFWHKGPDLDYSLIQNKYWSFLEELKLPMMKLLCEISDHGDTAEAQKLIEFNEAIHFITLVPFQLSYDQKEEKALVAYAIGTELLNKFWGKYYG